MKITKQVKTPTKTQPVANLLVVNLTEKDMNTITGGGQLNAI
ncbi:MULTISPECIES: hypothetical protein [unclassified Nostoc]|nr:MULTISPECIES: hypothetical protein [unclassified Nostoc]